ncbi:MAG: NUDIX domain-containing protein [Patescibacteria group bacterium]
MQTLQEITTLYPDIDVNLESGSDAFREGVIIVERDPIAVIIKHPHDNSYLIAKWKQTVWNGFLTGGIEDGDTLEDTVRKEIHEETGFKSVAKVEPMDYVTHGLFFHVVKNVNRLAHYHLVYAELADLDHDEVSEEEKSIADFVWVPKEEVLETLTRSGMKMLWQYFIEHK